MKCETSFHYTYPSGACSDVATHLIEYNGRPNKPVAICAGCAPLFRRSVERFPPGTPMNVVTEIVSVD